MKLYTGLKKKKKRQSLLTTKIYIGLWERMRTLYWQKPTDVYDQMIFHISEKNN